MEWRSPPCPFERRVATSVVPASTSSISRASGRRVGRAHGEVFGDIRPAAAMVEIRALIDPEMLVEIEVDAFVGS